MNYPSELYPFQSKQIRIDGNQIHYIDEGQGPTILFSHPPLASSFMYREIIKILSKNFRCIAFDFPGFGRSEVQKEESLGIVSQSKFITQFIKLLNLSDIILLGHDTGGPSAFTVAAENPKLFKGLILTDTIIFPVSEYPKISRMLSITGSRFFQWINAQTNLLVYLTYNLGIRTRKLQKVEKQVYFNMFNTPKKRKRITKVLSSLKREEDFMRNLKTSFSTVLNKMPLLLIYGENDPVNQIGIPQRIHQMTSNSSLYLVDNGGHFPHEGKPTEISRWIKHWVTSLIPQKEQI